MAITELGNIDIYLIDQLMKGRFSDEHKILDAGCGMGRNLKYFIDNKYDVFGIDKNEECIKSLQQKYQNDWFKVNDLNEIKFNDSEFDWVLSIAVLHFSKSKSEFLNQFSELIRVLKTNGKLFIRMTSNIGLDSLDYLGNGIYNLPDGTTRFLISTELISELLKEFAIKLVEPLKSVNVNNQRIMTTLIVEKVN